ncbi:hypothetical protein [Streptomyces monomycini]|uniref:hypothetical protein n=1 Tax=Streptomyces monomycini TaxID=371720 RepID=UPI0004AA0B7E|nr:hypothetical protein [Streptomyces monomycini]
MDPAEKLARWRAFAEDCTDGYPWDLEDYLVEVSSRSVLHEMITDSRGSGFAGQREADLLRVVAEIEAIDVSLRPVFGIEAFSRMPKEEWWLRCVPSYAARDICREFAETYGVSPAARSKFDVDADAMAKLFTEGALPADICLKAAGEGWYVAGQPALMYRACRRALPVDRAARRLIWAWANGKASESDLRSGLAG